MTTETNTVDNVTYTATWPDDVVFAFNPIYVKLFASLDSIRTLTLRVQSPIVNGSSITKEITVNLYSNTANVYVSRILQLLFTNIPNERYTIATITILKGTTTLFTHTLPVIWGRLDFGDRFNSYGFFHYDSKRPFWERTRVWFKNFPFKVTMYATSAVEGLTMRSKYDGQTYSQSQSIVPGLSEVTPADILPNAVYSAALKLDGVKASRGSSVFDNTFDFTFFSSSEYAVITNLPISNETAGHYLRWIDPLGQLQYYLFVKGKETIKNKQGSNSIVDTTNYGGMWFPDLTRITSVETTTTHKCCAVSLPDDVWAYVQTVVKSPYVDLYLGKTKAGQEIWMPVNIVAESHTYDPKELLHDLEISFTIPTHNSQTL